VKNGARRYNENSRTRLEDMDKPSNRGRHNLYAPRYWPTWLGIGTLWCLTRLPYALQIRIGRLLGHLVRLVATRRRHITEVNLALCFPEYSETERHHILVENFASMGIGMLEMGMSWWGSDKRLKKLCSIESLEHLNKALEGGKGAILLSAHFTTMEIGGRLLSMYTPFQVLYREHKNAAMEYVISRGRNKFTHKAILRDNLLGVRRSLNQNIPVWYAPDQDFGIGKSMFVPFFGIPAATITATSTLAKMAQSPVVPFYQTRLPGARGYRLTLLPAMENFPGNDIKEDTLRINELIEDCIRKHPEQYLWAHRRFKTRPKGERSFY
jgi:KDO2-lipid IV(A) lauroyltransferase